MRAESFLADDLAERDCARAFDVSNAASERALTT